MRHILLACLAVGCGSSDRAAGGGPDAPGSGGSHSTYEAFTPRTRSLGLAGDQFQLVLTDGAGTVACSLSQDQHNSLGREGHELITNVTYAAGYPCPTGTYSIPSTCGDEPGYMPYVQEHCAYYRQWDAAGQDQGLLPATAGSITVTGNETSCAFTVSASFSGMQFHDSFTLTNGLTAQPWCTP